VHGKPLQAQRARLTTPFCGPGRLTLRRDKLHWKNMRIISRLCLFSGLAAFALLTSCSTLAPTSKTYHVVAHKPHDPSKVRVLVSLSKQNVYVMEGDR
jgi:hypothetical protein